MHRQARVAIQYSHENSAKESTQSSNPITTATTTTNLFEHILSNKFLPAKEKEYVRIAQEGFVVLVAGGETTARVLTTATYHVLANRETVLQRLKDELTVTMRDPDTQVDLRTLEQLPWLVSPKFISDRHMEVLRILQTAVIKESLRITALVTSRLPLVSPQEHLEYGEWNIPAGVRIRPLLEYPQSLRLLITSGF